MPIVNTNTSNNTFTINGLTNGAEYRFRVAARNSNGIGPYTPYVNATPAANAVDQYFYQVSLLLHMDGDDNSTTFTDVSLSPKSVSPNGGVKISTAQSKFGGASAYFDGNGDMLSLPSSEAWDFGSSDFTIEMWVYLLSHGSPQPATGYNHYFTVVDQNTFGFKSSSSNGYYLYANSATQVQTSSAPMLNTWQHIALVRNGTSLKIYIDGLEAGSSTIASNTTYGSNSIAYIGSGWSGEFLHGYIDEFRITKGIARYTSNFAPSVIPFSQIPPPPTTPDAPTNLLAGSDADKIYLSWTQPEFDGNSSITDYQILFNRVSISGENVPDTISTIDTNNTNTVAEVAVTPDLKYEFSVKARNSVGLGPASSGVEILASGQYDLLYNKTRLLLHMNDNNDIRDLYLLAEDPYWSDVVLLMDMDGK